MTPPVTPTRRTPLRADLNCDLGESEPGTRTRALLRGITSANIACGGHAGTAETMEWCVREAVRARVRIGAHPGLPGGMEQSRRPQTISSGQLATLLLQQVSALERIARAQGSRLRHIKLHGALYYAAESSESLGLAYIQLTERWWPELRLYVPAGGRLARMAKALGRCVWEEGFLDRGYLPDGRLAPRTHPQALLRPLSEVRIRLESIRRGSAIAGIDGTPLRVEADTWCVHSDTPDALKILRLVRGLWPPRPPGRTRSSRS